MSPVNFGILGAADIAKRYTGAALSAAHGSALAAIAARDVARAEDLAQRLGAQALGSYDEVIDDPSIDAVYIPLPIGLHAHWALRAIERGKHVLCEKSLAGSLDDALAIIGAAREAGVLVMENFMCTYHEQNLRVRELIRGGGIGRLAVAEFSFGFPPIAPDDLKYNAELQGGALNDAGAYCLKMARYHVPSTPEWVHAVWSSGTKEVDIQGAAMLGFTGGEVAHLAWGFDNDYRNESRFWGQSGQVEIDRSFSIPPDRRPAVTLVRNGQREDLDLEPMNHFTALIGDFVRRAESGETTDVLRELAVQAVMLEATRRSAHERRPVKFAELPGWAPDPS